MKTVPEDLREKAALYEERNALYGDNYKRFGIIMCGLFPNGVALVTESDHNRFGILVQIIAKQTRYAANFERGGHDDSLDDIAVYSMMLKELDRGVFAPVPSSKELDSVGRSINSAQYCKYVGTDAMRWAEQFIATIHAPDFEVPNIWDKGFMANWFAKVIEQAKEAWQADRLSRSTLTKPEFDFKARTHLVEKIRDDERGRIKACYEGINDQNSAQREEWITSGYDPRLPVHHHPDNVVGGAVDRVIGVAQDRIKNEILALDQSDEPFNVLREIVGLKERSATFEREAVGHSEGSGTAEDTAATSPASPAHAPAAERKVPRMLPVEEEPGDPL